jgi:hypothetical protein
VRHTNTQDRFDPAQIRRRITRTLLLAGAISGAIVVGLFAIALLLFPLTRYLPQTVGSGELAQEVNWGLLEGITGLATLCLVIGGLVFALIEYRRSEIQDSRARAQSSFNIYKELYDKLTNPEATAARRWIVQNLPTLEQMAGDRDAWLARTKELLDQSPEGWTKARAPGRDHLKQILIVFDFIGFVASHYWTIENELVEWMNPLVAKVWERVYLCVEDEAKRRNEPDFYQAARDLGDRCLEWRRKHYEPSVIIDDGT